MVYVKNNNIRYYYYDLRGIELYKLEANKGVIYKF